MLVDPAFESFGNERVRVSLWRINKTDVELYRSELDDFFVESLNCDEEKHGEVFILEGSASLIRKKLVKILGLRSKTCDHNTFSVVEKLPKREIDESIDESSSSSGNGSSSSND